MSDAADGVDRATRAMGRSTAPSLQRYLASFGKSSTEEGVILCEMTVDGQREISPELYDGADD
jgi:hypothetical protein